MVAVVSGNGLGLDNSSLRQLGLGLGGQATIGQGSVASYLNAANGNLVVDGADEGLIFDGLPLNVLRTYNSQGQLSGNQGWQFGFSRSVGGLTGTLGTAGSTITRTGDDGSAVTYTYNSSLGSYVSSGQSGAQDTLTWSAGASTWTWADTANGQQETYNAGGQLTALSDTQSGAQYSFSYSAGQLHTITAGNGDTLTFGYTGSQLTSLSISEIPPGQTTAVTRQVGYQYDTQGRLSQVTTTLGSDTDSSTGSYTTTYTYDGSSDRVASIAQSDGTTVSYTYAADTNGMYRVHTVTTGTGAAAQTLTLGYNLVSNTTTLTDALGRTWSYAYDASGRLSAVTAPVVNGSAPTTTYQYDANGNVQQVTDADSGVTTYTYDARGNRIGVEDATGHTISTTYNADNQVLSQTVYTVPAQGIVGQPGYVAPSGAQTTYYVYDANDRLSFVIDPLGQVAEHDYATSFGVTVLSSTRQYLGASYNLAGLSPASPPSLAAVQTWVASAPVHATLAQTMRVDYSYDVRGQLASMTQWDTVDGSGAGVLDAATTITTYSYDAQGRLLQSAIERGSDRSGRDTSSYAYDGLGRLISTTDALGQVTSYVYTDSSDTLAITQANGLVTTQVRNSAGQLISSTQSASGQASRTTSYLYDTAGQNVAVIDAAGQASYTFYDADGRVAGTVDAAGAVTAYAYDADGHLVGSTQYATTINTNSWVSGGVLTASLPTNLPVPTASANDRTSHVILDASGRTLATIDALGNVSTITYDGEGHAIATTAYATALTTAQQTALGSTPSWTALHADLTPNPLDRTAYTVYDADGQVAAVIDAAGYVTTHTVDAAGRVVLTHGYATALTTAQRAALGSTPALASLQADLVTSDDDQVTRTWYNGEGQVVAQVDADGYLTAMAYDATTRTDTTTRYATALTKTQRTALTGKESVATLVALLGASPASQTSTAVYDADGQVTSRTAADGTLTTYSYNAAGQLLGTTVTPLPGQGQGQARTTLSEYDAFGDVVGKLDGVAAGAHPLTGLNAAQQAAVFAQYGTTYGYNTLGQRASVTDPLGNTTWMYYDADGRLAYTVQGQPSGSTRNALGNVIAYSYNAFGQVTATRTYASQVTLTGGSSSGTTLNPATATLAQMATAAAALPMSASDANGLTSYTYTLDGQVASQTDGLGYQVLSTYDAFGDRTQVQQQLSQPGSALNASNSTTTQYTYAVDGSQASEIDGAGSTNASTSSTSYDAFGRLSQSTDGNGNVTSYSYDPLGRQVSLSEVVSGTTRTTQTTYDAFGRTVTQTDALGNVTSFQYDVANHKVLVTTPDNIRMTTVTDAFGDTVSVTDGTGNTTAYSYDLDGQLLTTTDALGHVSSSQYDADGELIQTTDATGNIVTYSYDASGRVLTRTVDPSDLDTDGLNLITTYAYDGQGSTLNITDPMGTVTTYAYDADGNVLTQVQDAGELNLTTISTYDGAGKTLTVTVGAGTDAARTTQYVYDKLERLSQQIVDPGTGHLNLTTTYAYDANSNLTSVIDANGNIRLNVYDAANESVFTIDPTGAVTQMWYDANGRVTSTQAYAVALTSSQLAALGPSPSVTAVTASVTASSSDVITYTAYNAEGQVRYSIDPLGHVTETRYDTVGRISETLAYGDAITVSASEASSLQQSTGLASVGVLVSAAGNTDANAEATLNLYDADGQTRFVVQQNLVNGQLVGIVTEQQYDAAGRVIAGIAHGGMLSLSMASSLAAQWTTASVAQAVAPTPREVTQYVYDNAGRLRYTINSLDQVTGTQYDNDGRVTEILNYPAPIVVPGNLTVASVGQAVFAANAMYVVTSQVEGASGTWMLINQHFSTTTYDAVGRVLNTGDWYGISASYTYDATGLQLTQTDRDGNRTAITYDKAARKTLVQSPAVMVASYNGSGVLQAATIQHLYTSYTYDNMGNTLSTSRGSGLSADGITNQSTITYAYDPAGRLTATTYAGTPAFSTTAVYDTFGQKVVSTDGNGNSIYMAYDLSGQLVSSMDTNRFVTATAYDGFGNVTSVTHYSAPLPSDFNPIWTPGHALTAGQMRQKQTFTINDRMTFTSYDLLNQIVAVTQQSIPYALGMGPAADTVMATGQPATTYTYDAYGNQTSSSTLLQGAGGSGANATPAIWAATYSYYDELNRVVMTVIPAGSYANPQGYVTTTAYNHLNQVASIDQYAAAISTANVTTASAPATPAASTFDRLTAYSYDLIGRRISESDTGAINYNDGTSTAGITTLSSYSAWQYNGENQVTATTVNGVTSTAVYDGAGRLIEVIAPARNVLVSNWYSILASVPADDLTTAGLYTSVSPTTSYIYDALGNVLSTKVNSGTATTTSLATYDALGQQLTSTDADGNVTTNTYDHNGNLLTQSYVLTGNDASTTVTTVNTYDIHNRRTSTAVSRSGHSGYDSYQQVSYNNFGDVLAEGDSSGFQAHYSYDNGGNLVSAVNGTTGAVQTLTYDLDHHAILASTAGTNYGAAVVTQNVINLSGRIVQQLTPNTNGSVGTIESSAMTYDRWGNVTSTTDAKGNVTQYVYNSQNQLIEQIEPTVTVVSATGVSSTTSPTKYWYYDVRGLLKQTTDENGHSVSNTYDAAGNLTITQDAAGAKTYRAYNGFGIAIAQEAPPVSTATGTVAHITYTTTDGMGQVIAEGDFQLNAAGTARTQQPEQAYVLNSNGDRRQVTDALNHTTYYDYDSQHRVIKSQTPLQRANGQAQTYAYDDNGQLIHQTDADGYTQSWVYDYFGRLLSHVDESGATYTYTYDANSGLLTKETSNWTASGPAASVNSTMNFSYEADGQMASVNQVVGGVASIYAYQYDANGNETQETDTTQDGSGHVVTVTTNSLYDSHDRLSHFSQSSSVNTPASLTVPTLAISYSYDAAGNRREVVATSGSTSSATGSTTTDWYTYDADNRVLVTNGSLVSGQIVITDATNSALSGYDAAGDVTLYTTVNASHQTLSQKNTYDARGELTMIQSQTTPGGSYAKYETRSYDANGHLLTDVMYNLPGHQGAGTYNGSTVTFSDAGWVASDTIYTYNASGQLTDLSEYVEDTAQDLITKYGAGVATSAYATQDAAAPSTLPTVGSTTVGALYLATETSYTAVSSGYGYDADGNLLGYRTITPGTLGQTAQTDSYKNSYVLQDNSLNLKTTASTTSGTFQPNTNSNTYNDLGELTATSGTVNGNAINNAMAFTSDGKILQDTVGSSATVYAYANDQGVASINNSAAVVLLDTTSGFSNSVLGSQNYTVQAGDTLQSLAQAIYGNGNYDYILAEANGLQAGMPLTAGSILKIPQLTTHTNSSTTFKPYSQSSIVNGGAATCLTTAQLITNTIQATLNQQSALAQAVKQIQAQEAEQVQEAEQAGTGAASTMPSQQAHGGKFAQKFGFVANGSLGGPGGAGKYDDSPPPRAPGFHSMFDMGGSSVITGMAGDVFSSGGDFGLPTGGSWASVPNVFSNTGLFAGAGGDAPQGGWTSSDFSASSGNDYSGFGSGDAGYLNSVVQTFSGYGGESGNDNSSSSLLANSGSASGGLSSWGGLSVQAFDDYGFTNGVSSHVNAQNAYGSISGNELNDGGNTGIAYSGMPLHGSSGPYVNFWNTPGEGDGAIGSTSLDDHPEELNGYIGMLDSYLHNGLDVTDFQPVVVTAHAPPDETVTQASSGMGGADISGLIQSFQTPGQGDLAKMNRIDMRLAGSAPGGDSWNALMHQKVLTGLTSQDATARTKGAWTAYQMHAIEYANTNGQFVGPIPAWEAQVAQDRQGELLGAMMFMYGTDLPAMAGGGGEAPVYESVPYLDGSFVPTDTIVINGPLPDVSEPVVPNYVATGNAQPLTYDISAWKSYGLPSDGYFARTLNEQDAFSLMQGDQINFGGKPVDGYPGGMGFLGSAEEVSSINTGADYANSLDLTYQPKYLLEFQLNDPTGLQNVLEAPYKEFVPGGQTASGYLEWNYPGINSNNIVNWRLRVLQ